MFHSGFIAIVGRPNVGKSTLTNRLVGQKIAIVSDKPQTTRSRIMGVCARPDAQIVFLDTPGIHEPRNKLGEHMAQAIEEALSEIDGLMVIVDGAHIGKKDREIIERFQNASVPSALIINKIDQMTPESLAPLLASLPQNAYRDVFPISARTGEGVDALLDTLFSWMPEGPRYFPDDMVTDQPERVVIAEMVREKALWYLREEIPHGIGIEILSITPLPDDRQEIHANILCERESHKAIILGKQGAMIKRIGTAARGDIEKMLGHGVNLKLWVKVRENWRNAPPVLRDLGYE